MGGIDGVAPTFCRDDQLGSLGGWSRTLSAGARSGSEAHPAVRPDRPSTSLAARGGGGSEANTAHRPTYTLTMATRVGSEREQLSASHLARGAGAEVPFRPKPCEASRVCSAGRAVWGGGPMVRSIRLVASSARVGQDAYDPRAVLRCRRLQRGSTASRRREPRGRRHRSARVPSAFWRCVVYAIGRPRRGGITWVGA